MQAVITAEGLTRRYPGVTALDALALEVPPGIVGLVGANGAGKTTLIKILLGLLPPTAGTVGVLGLDPVRQGAKVRELVGYMPEHDCLPPDLSATELVVHMARVSGLPATAARERAADTLRHVGLYEERYRHIGGYSTGMKQRVKLAQALVHDPALVLLDEPTNGLDPAGRAEMLALVRRVGTEFGISILVSSHHLGEIERICTHVVVIDAGRLLRSSAIGGFTERSGVLVVEVDERAGELAARLADGGIRTREDGRTLLVDLRDEATYDAIRDAIADLGLGLVRLEQRRAHIEDVFRDAPPSERRPEEVQRVGAR
ncbi:MAG TPA: ABC transporter ATP-binding protein [Candidatus Dormibacteraeota bacterium]|nr:ABC transporter ATP-binding protein [Candidatus Dormibacteraeota bacterium]